jgi:hypothetical protein
MGQATTAKVRLDTGKAARFTASAQSTGWFDDPSSPSAQFTVAREDVRGSFAGRKVTGNLGNVG